VLDFPHLPTERSKGSNIAVYKGKTRRMHIH
jgi:hypothetical protein